MQKSMSRALFIFLIAFQLFACKKEADEKGPLVSFISPFDGQSFTVNDNMVVKADISDETGISSVVITLVDASKIPVHNSLSVPVPSPKGSINAVYPLDNIHLENGLYYVMITASDGKNDSHTYQPVYITAIPKVLKKIVVATNNGNPPTDMYFIDSTFSGMSFYYTFSGDYEGVAASSYFQQVYMCGNYNGAFTGIALSTGAVKFSYAPFISPDPAFTAFYSEDINNYVARYNQSITGYNNTGVIVFNAAINSDYYARKLIMNNGYMVAEEISKTTAQRILTSFFKTGVSEQQVSINQDVVALCEKDDHDVFAFGNSAGQGVIQLYDRISNNLWSPYPYSLPTGTILSAVRIDADTYLIGHSNGNIYKYQYQNSSITTYLTGYTALQLKYDKLNRTVYIVESHRITGVDAASSSIVNSVNSSQNILGIDLLYNR